MAEVDREKRDSAVVAQYFEGKTLVEVARDLKLSDERVRQILLEQGYSTRPPGVRKSPKLKFRPTDKDRFLRRIISVDKWSECWIWKSKSRVRPRFSYTFSGRKITEYANRSSRWFFLGIRGELRLRSVCRNPRCVHPLHWLPK
jgi:hypothetical protein